jgi:aspartate-semialdehyde dehydrogenase
MKIRRAGTLGSNFIIVTHYLQHLGNTIPVLKFQMDNAQAEDAQKLGEEIKRIIKARITSPIEHNE